MPLVDWTGTLGDLGTDAAPAPAAAPKKRDPKDVIYAALEKRGDAMVAQAADSIVGKKKKKKAPPPPPKVSGPRRSMPRKAWYKNPVVIGGGIAGTVLLGVLLTRKGGR